MFPFPGTCTARISIIVDVDKIANGLVNDGGVTIGGLEFTIPDGLGGVRVVQGQPVPPVDVIHIFPPLQLLPPFQPLQQPQRPTSLPLAREVISVQPADNTTDTVVDPAKSLDWLDRMTEPQMRADVRTVLWRHGAGDPDGRQRFVAFMDRISQMDNSLDADLKPFLRIVADSLSLCDQVFILAGKQLDADDDHVRFTWREMKQLVYLQGINVRALNADQADSARMARSLFALEQIKAFAAKIREAPRAGSSPLQWKMRGSLEQDLAPSLALDSRLITPAIAAQPENATLLKQAYKYVKQAIDAGFDQWCNTHWPPTQMLSQQLRYGVVPEDASTPPGDSTR